MPTLQKRYSIVDFFETWIKTVPGVIWPILALAFAALLPGAVLLGLSIGPYIAGFADMASRGSEYSSMNPGQVLEMFRGLLPSLSMMMLGILVTGIGFLYASLSVQWLLSARARGENPNFPTTLKAIFPKIFFSRLLAVLLEGLLYFGLFLGSVIVIGIVMAILGLTLGKNGAFLVAAFGLLLYLGFIFILVSLNNYLTVVQPAVVEGSTGGKAIRESFKLIRKNFWRILGMRIVISLAVSIASSIILLIPSFVLFLPTLLQAIPLLSNPGLLAENSRPILEALSGLGVPMIITTFLGCFLQLLTDPVFSLMFFYDLKVRQGLAPDLSLPPTLPADENPAPTTETV